MKNIVSKIFIAVISAVFLFSVYSGVSPARFFINDVQQCSTVITVCAVEEDTATQSSNDKAEKTENNDVEEPKKPAFKITGWMIAFSCVISLIIAIFLAIRKANKIYGNSWD